jgi:hypothetical protein
VTRSSPQKQGYDEQDVALIEDRLLEELARQLLDAVDGHVLRTNEEKRPHRDSLIVNASAFVFEFVVCSL